MKSWLIVGMVGFLFAGCRKDHGDGAVILQFDHQVGGEALTLEDLRYPCAAGHTFSVVNLKYYLSAVVLHEKGGRTIAFPEYHLTDIHQAPTLQWERTGVPEGTYDLLTFIFGLNEQLNVDGGLPNTVENAQMEWPIPGDQGYHYMKFEGRYDSLNTGVIRSFNLHTGATMGNANYVQVSLPVSGLHVDGNTWTIRLTMDLNEWLQNPNIFDFAGHEAIMMDQASQALIQTNGATVFSITSVTSD